MGYCREDGRGQMGYCAKEGGGEMGQMATVLKRGEGRWVKWLLC